MVTRQIEMTDGSPSPRSGVLVCVGRNYADHAREMGAVPPAEPLLFLKPPSALLPGGGELRLPTWSREVHHEVELVALLGEDLRDADPERAAAAVAAYAVGLDLTARDVQARAKEKGHPWSVAKGWPGSAPVSAFRPAGEIEDSERIALRLEVNGEARQEDTTASMLWPVPRLLSFASSRLALEAGDLLFTGTPAGVGPLRPGDRVVAEAAGVGRLELSVRGD
jgi:2-keto-4-pentenoate hydratase/2-oxohepta-3-ene-1,7-dioic acid hydratase in catechol pathway